MWLKQLKLLYTFQTINTNSELYAVIYILFSLLTISLIPVRKKKQAVGDSSYFGTDYWYTVGDSFCYGTKQAVVLLILTRQPVTVLILVINSQSVTGRILVLNRQPVIIPNSLYWTGRRWQLLFWNLTESQWQFLFSYLTGSQWQFLFWCWTANLKVPILVLNRQSLSSLFGTKQAVGDSSYFGTKQAASDSSYFGTELAAQQFLLVLIRQPVIVSTFCTEQVVGGSSYFGSEQAVGDSSYFGTEPAAGDSDILNWQ